MRRQGFVCDVAANVVGDTSTMLFHRRPADVPAAILERTPHAGDGGEMLMLGIHSVGNVRVSIVHDDAM
jgi:hypothetical protein